MLSSKSSLLRSFFSRECSLYSISSRSISKGELRAQNLLDELYSSIQGQKFEDIVVLQTKFNADPRYIVLASAFNARHLVNGTEEINKGFKKHIREDDQEFAKVSISKEWNVIDFSSVVVHLFSKNCRLTYDLEQLWSVGEQYDDLTNLKPTEASLKDTIVNC